MKNALGTGIKGITRKKKRKRFKKKGIKILNKNSDSSKDF